MKFTYLVLIFFSVFKLIMKEYMMDLQSYFLFKNGKWRKLECKNNFRG